jgi:hypothetical protein
MPNYAKLAKTLTSLVKGTQDVLPVAEREANFAKFLEPSKVPQRLYHGTTATEGSKGQEAIRRIKPSKEGSLGSGVYLTPNSSRASGYAESPWDSKLNLERHSPNVLPVHAQIRNPLIIDGTHSDPMIEALTKLGMEEGKAARMVEKAYEDKGYIGKQVESRARAAGYDGLMQYRDGELSEVVSYNPNAVKSAIGNRGTYDPYNPQLNEAHGGAVHMQVGGLPRLAKALTNLAKGADEAPKVMPAIKKVEAWHGSPHRFAPTSTNPLGQFDPTKIGTGEGNQAFGYGHYLAQAPTTAKGYRAALSNRDRSALSAIKPTGEEVTDYNILRREYYKPGRVVKGYGGYDKVLEYIPSTEKKPWAVKVQGVLNEAGDPFPKYHMDNRVRVHATEPDIEHMEGALNSEGWNVKKGNLYKVELPEEHVDRMMSWAEPLPEELRQKINSAATEKFGVGTVKNTGSHIYNELSREFERLGSVNPTADASEFLRQQGVTGVKYPDRASRSSGEGTHNFVVFPNEEDAINIVHREKKGGLIDMNKAQGGLAHFQLGGLTKAAKAAKEVIEEIVEGAPALAKASQRADAGRRAADVAKATAPMRLSEVLGNMNLEGKGTLRGTIADRTRVGGGNIGGPMFSGLQQVDPLYENAVWGVGKKGTASGMINKSDPNTLWSTILGNESQLKTNPLVFNKLRRGFTDAMKQGKLSDDLAKKINENLAFGFGEGADIRDPRIWQKADTFDKRAILADVMMGQNVKGGIPLGGEKSGKGVIFQPSEILKRETEPMLLHPEHGGDVPSYSVGPRLFNLSGEVEHRPDLHPGFPFILKGEDKGVVFKPPEGHIAMPDFTNEMKKKYGRTPGYFDWMMGKKDTSTGVTLTPMQEITDAYLTSLQKAGHKDGGSVDNQSFDQRLKDAIAKHMAEGGEASQDMDVAGLLQNSMDRGKDVPKFDEGGTTKAEKTKGNPLTKYASAAKKIAVEEFLKEKEALSTPRGAKDIALKIGTSFTGQLPSLMNLAQRMIPSLNEPTSVMNPSGETQLKYRIPYDTEEQNEVLKRIGALGETEAPVVEFAGSLLGPAQLYKAIKGGLNAAKAR